MSNSSSGAASAELGLGTPLAAVRGIGPLRARALAKAGLSTVEDLLWRLPFRYEDRSRLSSVQALEPGRAATLRVEVVRNRLVRTRRRGFSLVEMRVKDPSGALDVVFFNQPYLADSIAVGSRVFLYGIPERKRLFIELLNPEIEPAGDPGSEGVHSGRIVPVYERLGSLGPRAHRTIISNLMEALNGRIQENLPAEIIRAEALPDRSTAFREVHLPTSLERQSDSVRRLAFEELFIEQLGIAVHKGMVARDGGATALQVSNEQRETLRRMLPYRLTRAQRRVSQEIVKDLARSVPMRRLLQGDVGSGKTIVAALALAIAALNDGQAVLMAPTELLAEQHARNLTPALEAVGIRVGLLTAQSRGSLRRRLLDQIASGDIRVAIGTHALIQRDVHFKKLVLAVVDEQHRFGVVQRESLGSKGSSPHVLVMTATPIPRSLALTSYGDLDLSVIDELPPGRRPVRTVIKTGDHEAEAYTFVRRCVDEGSQAYVICPLVEGTEVSDLKAAEDWARQAAELYFRGVSTGLVHGRQKGSERSRLMTAFSSGDIQVLFGTTVLEVGVDVANASVMLVEHAERFGLSQLHQLRGRIGRGRRASTCILMVREKVGELARKRLAAVRGSSDGFAIAEADLRLRGPGELRGTRQWGLPSFRVANLLRDFELLERARAYAARLAADQAWIGSPAAQQLLGSSRGRHLSGLVG